MKYIRWFIIGLLFYITIIGYAQITYYANQITITWDAPTTYENGDPLPVDLDIYYDVYIREKDGEQIYLGETMGITYSVTFSIANKKYDIGVVAKYQLDNTWFYSVMNWSIDDVLNQESWDVGFFVPVDPPMNIRIE